MDVAVVLRDALVQMVIQLLVESVPPDRAPLRWRRWEFMRPHGAWLWFKPG
jgi:hypothetical protein